MSTTTQTRPDEQPVPAAVGELIRILNDGAIAVLGSIGYQTGLFEALATLPPATSQQVADAAGLNERYVREWLGGITVAGLITYDPAARTYALSPEYAPFLTGPTADNIARSLRFITLMGEVTSKVAEKFRTGGGLAYSDYPDFYAVQAEDSGAVHDAALIDTILPVTEMVEALRTGIDVVDIGCGQGHAINLMAREFPRSRFTGLDFGAEALERARAEAAAWGLTNATFVECDLAAPVEPATYDLVTAFDVIHDQARPAQVLANVRTVLRPGGTFLMADFNVSSHLERNLELPWASLIYALSTAHCMSVSLGQGGAGLGTAWGVELAEQMLHEAGFATVEQHHLDADPFNVYIVARP